MKPRSFVHALVLLAGICTISSAKPPSLKLTHDKRDTPAEMAPGEFFHLLLQVEPTGDGFLADSVEVEPAAVDGVEFGKAILPPDVDGIYNKPFAVRLPARFADAKERALTVTLKAKTVGGAAFAEQAGLKLRPLAGALRHVSGSASLKAPAVVGEANTIVLKLNVTPPYHVYGTEVEYGLPMTAELVPVRGALWSGGAPTSPDGNEYHDDFTFEVPFTPLMSGKVETNVLLFWQACTPEICDPNEIAYLPVSFDVAPGAGGAKAVDPKETDEAVAVPVSAKKKGLGSKGLWKIIVAAILAGLFALAMPCTYPMIPITISFFTKQAEARHGNVAPLAIAYGLGIVGIFMGLGVLVGRPIVDFAATWPINAVFAILFLLFGLSLIGLFEIRLPSFFNDMAAKASGGSGYLGVFAMGATLVITSFTCTAPFVGTVIVAASQGGDIGRVALAMGVFGLTMAIPFVFLSMSPNAMQKLPRSGEWMKTLKVTLGIVELGLVLKFVSNIDIALGFPIGIDRETFLGLWTVSFLAAAIYLFKGFGIGQKLRVAVGGKQALVAALILALSCYLWTGMDGSPFRAAPVVEAFLPRIPEKPGSTKTHVAGRVEYSDAFQAVVHENYTEGVTVAQAKNAPIFLHFTGFN